MIKVVISKPFQKKKQKNSFDFTLNFRSIWSEKIALFLILDKNVIKKKFPLYNL